MKRKQAKLEYAMQAVKKPSSTGGYDNPSSNMCKIWL